jgi:DNA-binding response OmpR family regulator
LPRILIVDDDPDLLSVCTVGLTALGHQVWTAQTGAEGLDQAAIRAPEVIVLDLGLPDLDGLAVCRRIRTWSDVPIVVLSADGSEDRKVDALDQGADDYMTKPFGMRELSAGSRSRYGTTPPQAMGNRRNSTSVTCTLTWSTTRQPGTAAPWISPPGNSTSSPISPATPARSAPGG